MKNLKFIFLLFLPLFLTGCFQNSLKFEKGDIKDDFCGQFISAAYCKCAFHNEYCDSIGMDKKEAKNYVNDEYDKWVEEEKQSFASRCQDDNGYMKGDSCIYCESEETVVDGKCRSVEEGVVSDEEDGDQEDDINKVCKYDSDCDPICEGNIAWKMGCNPRENKCEKTFDTDCSADVEEFSSLSFPKVCAEGVCIRDDASITEMKATLEGEKQYWSETVKAINSTRQDLNTAMLDANKNCINGIADMTNVAIMEFSTRIASVLAGGIPDIAAMSATAAEKAAGLMSENMKNLAGGAVDYAGEAVNRLYNYTNGEPSEEEKKLKPHEYIKLNCDLYEYFKGVLAESENDLDVALEEANKVDQLIKSLP